MSSPDPSTPDRGEGSASNPPTFFPPGYAAPTPGQGAYPSAPGQGGFPAPQAYPQQPGYPPAQPPYPAPGEATGWPGAPGEATGLPTAPTQPIERVGRGLLFSLGGIVVGVVLTVLIWKLNFIASLTSFAMAYACVWLYTRGAGRAPRKGVGALIAVIVAGVVVSLASVIAVDALDYLGQDYPDATLTEKVDFVLSNIFRPEVWQSYTSEVLMYVLFAALGTFGLIRQLGRAKGA